MTRVQTLWTVAAVLLPVYAYADLEVTDAEGRPLEEAVVEIYWPNEDSGARARHEQSVLHEIMQRDAAFEPQVVAIATGDYIVFPNRDTARHQVFSFSPAKTFSLDLYLQETPPPVEFDTPGVVVLGCNIHDRMQAFAVVSEAPFYAMTDENGRVDTGVVPAGNHRLRVWHPHLEPTHQQWWEGRFEGGHEKRVVLSLAAIPSEPEPPSALQQRFRQAAGQGS